ncbi:LOC500567 [Phodopus roborovskii]|uniref:LOC500567 protein n=1 Tax=Phodopus roborovskii TaxID=109678 RepID=A0AAV0ABP1_PHORO|nr:LOC500567 [Phodopus roborovskii]
MGRSTGLGGSQKQMPVSSWQLCSVSAVPLLSTSGKRIALPFPVTSHPNHTYPRLALPEPDLCLTHLCVPRIE